MVQYTINYAQCSQQSITIWEHKHILILIQKTFLSNCITIVLQLLQCYGSEIQFWDWNSDLSHTCKIPWRAAITITKLNHWGQYVYVHGVPSCQKSRQRPCWQYQSGIVITITEKQLIHEWSMHMYTKYKVASDNNPAGSTSQGQL